MRTTKIGKSDLVSSILAYGCMRIGGSWEPAKRTPEEVKRGVKAIVAAYEAGYTLFDHADIYCRGESERVFGAALRQVPEMRRNILIASKCGVRFAGDPTPEAPPRYDFSAEHILRSCEASLRRLGVETIDLYQLHRPDFLAHPNEVAGAFDTLRQQGKVREFGVSNFRSSLLTALQKACAFPLQVNQIEVSLLFLDPLTDGTLDQCLAEGISPLVWSPLAGGVLGDGGTPVVPHGDHPDLPNLLATLDQTAAKYGVDRSALAIAWLLAHPSGMIPIVGSTQPARLVAAARAAEIALSREDWYTLLIAARGERLP